MFQDGSDDLPVFNEGQDAHDSPTLRPKPARMRNKELEQVLEERCKRKGISAHELKIGSRRATVSKILRI